MIGILALQGGFAKHREKLTSMSVPSTLIRNTEDLSKCEALIIPGGESTTMFKLIESEGLKGPLLEFDRPVFGTCAGLILMQAFGWLDISVERNGWGRQRDSFEADLDGVKAIFIRAPRIRAVGEKVEVLKTFKGEPVLVRQGNYLGATFHPELTDSNAIHEIFLKALAV